MIDTTKIASWLAQAWTEYMQHGEKIRLEPRSHGFLSDKPHASQLSMCAKKHAASRLGLIEKEEFDMQTLRRIENGFRIGESVAEAVTWYADKLNELNASQRNGKRMRVTTESSMETERLAGTPDIILDYEGQVFPVEVKHTEHPFPMGFSWYQITQLIGYMTMLEAKTGYLFTAYPMSDTQQLSHRVWIVQENDVGDGWYVLDQYGNNVKTEYSTYPQTWDKTIYYTRSDFNKLLDHHATWEKVIKEQGLIEERPSDINGDTDWRCRRHIKPDYYKVNTKNAKAGDLKPGTGITKSYCPLFGVCYPHVTREETSE